MSHALAHPHFVRAAPAIFVFLWSTGYVGARYGLPYAEPLTLTSMRFALVLVILSAIVATRGSRLPRAGSMWGHLAVAGLLIHTCFIGGIFTAIHLGTDISIAALIAGGQPLLTAIVAVTLLGETLTRRQWGGFILGFAGLVLVVTRGLTAGAVPPLGLLACIIALAGMTFGTLYQKRFVVGVDLLAGSAAQFGFALIPCLLWAWMFETREVVWTTTLVLAIAWLVLALSIGAISVLLFLIREGAATRVSSLFYLVPPVTALQGYLLFDEHLGVVQVAGIGVTAIGVAMINYSNTAPSLRARV